MTKDYKVNIKVTSPSGKIITGWTTFAFCGDAKIAAMELAEEIGGNLIFEMFNEECIKDKSLDKAEILITKNDYWECYYSNSKIEWELENLEKNRLYFSKKICYNYYRK